MLSRLGLERGQEGCAHRPRLLGGQEGVLSRQRLTCRPASPASLAGLHPGLLEPPTPGHQCHPWPPTGWQARRQGGRHGGGPGSPKTLVCCSDQPTGGDEKLAQAAGSSRPSEQEAAATAPGQGRGVGGHHAGLPRAPKACLAGRSWGLRSSSWGRLDRQPCDPAWGSPRRAPTGQGRAPRERQREVSLGRAFGTHPLADMLNTLKTSRGHRGRPRDSGT